MKQSFGLLFFEVEAIQKRTVAFGARASAIEKDAARTRSHHRLPVGEHLANHHAGIFIAVAHVAAEDHFGRFRGVVEVDGECPRPTFVAVKIVDHGIDRLIHKLYAVQAMLHLEGLAGLAGEGRVPHQNAVAMRHLFFGIAAVQGFGPEQAGTVVGTPEKVAGSDRDAVYRHAIFKRKARDLAFEIAYAIPNFHFFWKGRVIVQIRIRPMNAGCQHMRAIGRHGNRGVKRRPPIGRYLAAGDINIGELRGAVIVEQIFVVRVFESVRIGPDAGSATFALLNFRPLRRGRTLRRGPAIGRNHAHQQRLSVRHPGNGRTQNRIEFDAIDTASFGCRGGRHPEFHTVHGGRIGEGEVVAVDAPTRHADAR